MAVTIKGFASDWSVPEPAKAGLGAALSGTFATLDAQGKQPVRKGELEVNVKDHGVTGNGSTDDAPAINALISSTTGGVTLFFPPGDYRIGSPIVLRDGVFLAGRRAGYGYLASGSRWGTRFRALGSPASLVTGPATPLYAAGVQGIDFEGGGTAVRAIHIPDAVWCHFRDIHFNNFLDQFVLIEGGNATMLDNMLGVNGLRRPVAERATRVGSIQLGGSDHMISRIETGGGYTPGAMTADGLNTGIYVTGTSMFFTHIVSEFSETGFYIGPSATGNRFSLCRADKGGGHGFITEGKDNLFTACHVANMSREADNVYTGFRNLSGGRGNSYAACRVHYTTGYPNWMKYGFEDLTDGGTMQDRTSWTGCTAQYRTAMFYGMPGGGSAPVTSPHPQRYAANGPVLDVTNTGIAFLAGYNTPTTVTSMTGGVNGQTVKVLGNANVTFAHNGSVGTPGSINTSTGANKVLAPNKMYTFTHYQGIWYENA